MTSSSPSLWIPLGQRLQRLRQRQQIGANLHRSSSLASSPWAFVALLTLAALPVWSQTPAAGWKVTSLATPAGPGSQSPFLATTSAGQALTWLQENGEGYDFLVSTWDGSKWSTPALIAHGDDFFANWADIPSIVEAGPGELVAQWLRMLGKGTYAYGIQLSRSTDGGKNWQRLGWLQDDLSPNEHGFVSFTRHGDRLWAFWLDGRAMANDGESSDHGNSEGGAMQLRASEIVAGVPKPSVVLDDRVCECCPTATAAAADGPLVVYRNRSDAEIRDTWLVRYSADGWSPPHAVFEDGWQIAGCPVNGPAIAAAGKNVVVVWFTGAGDKGRTLAAISRDRGLSFGSPILVDEDDSRGRVGVALNAGRAFVTSLGRESGGSGNRDAAVLLRMISLDDGEVSPALTVARSSAGRSSGIARLLRETDRSLLVAWVNPKDSRVEVSRVTHGAAGKTGAP